MCNKRERVAAENARREVLSRGRYRQQLPRRGGNQWRQNRQRQPDYRQQEDYQQFLEWRQQQQAHQAAAVQETVAEISGELRLLQARLEEMRARLEVTSTQPENSGATVTLAQREELSREFERELLMADVDDDDMDL